MVHWVIWVVVAIGVGVAAASFIPIPGYYNVQVDVTAQEVSLIFVNVFSISSVQAHVTGSSTLLDWGGLLGIGLPALSATFEMTVCLGANHCTSKSATQWFPTIPIINGASVSATTQFALGYIPAGQYSISVTLTQNGGTVATGSGSICVEGSC